LAAQNCPPLVLVNHLPIDVSVIFNPNKKINFKPGESFSVEDLNIPSLITPKLCHHPTEYLCEKLTLKL
jgi:hypothetical protein